VRAIIFDLGHTIIDFGPAEDALRDAYSQVLTLLRATASAELPSAEHLIERVTYRIFNEINASYLRQELEELDILQMFDAALHDLGFRLDAATIRQIAELEHRALSTGMVLPESNRDIVGELRGEGYKIGLVSNVTLLPHLMREDMARLGLLDYFDVTVFSSEEMIRKPHPRIYQVVLERLAVAPAEAVFVGDRLREDVRGPKEAGMRAVLTTQFRQEDPSESDVQPDGIIDELPELHDILVRWRSGT
jgi:FMN phosphatase YigB (HAD superfamily)